MASGGGYHGAGIFGRADIAVPDDRNLDRLLHRPNPFPASIAAVALLASAGMESYRREPAALRHLRQLDTDDLLIIPAGPELHGERNAHRGANRLEDFSDTWQITQQAGPAIALDHLFCGTAQI